MHHRYIAEICRPEFIYFPADSKGLALFASTLQAPEKLHIALGVLLQSFKVNQGNLNWYQSKAHTRLSISPPLYEHVTVSPLSLCDYFLSFSCYNDLVVANLFFSPLYQLQSCWKPSQERFPRLSDMKVGVKKLESPIYPTVETALS